MCHVHNPELKDSSDKRNVIAAPSSSWQYVPKQRQPAPGVPKIADTGGHQAAVLPHNLDKSVASDVAIAAPEVATSVKEPILDSEAVPENTRPKDDAAVHVNDPSPSTNASSPSMKEPLLVSEAAVREVSDRVAMTPIIVAQDAPGILTQQPSERSPIGDASSVLLEQEVGFPAKPVEFVEDNRFTDDSMLVESVQLHLPIVLSGARDDLQLLVKNNRKCTYDGFPLHLNSWKRFGKLENYFFI